MKTNDFKRYVNCLVRLSFAPMKGERARSALDTACIVLMIDRDDDEIAHVILGDGRSSRVSIPDVQSVAVVLDKVEPTEAARRRVEVARKEVQLEFDRITLEIAQLTAITHRLRPHLRDEDKALEYAIGLDTANLELKAKRAVLETLPCKIADLDCAASYIAITLHKQEIERKRLSTLQALQPLVDSVQSIVDGLKASGQTSGATALPANVIDMMDHLEAALRIAKSL